MVANIGLSAVATGTADIITATYSPAITLTDRRIVFLTGCVANVTTTPTFNPNALGAQVIKGKGGVALKAGEILGDCILIYHTTGTYWELLNSSGFLTSANIVETITNGVIDKAPSENAVFDALALKQNTVAGVDDTEIGYLNGVTSSIQTQLDSKVCSISFFHTSNQSIADSTSYFLAHVTAPATALANSSMVPVKAGTLVGVSLGGFNASTVGSNEAWTVKLWYNDGLNSVTLTTAFTGGNANRNYFLDVDGLSTAISDGNCAVEFIAPALATNPTGFRGTATIYIRP